MMVARLATIREAILRLLQPVLRNTVGLGRRGEASTRLWSVCWRYRADAGSCVGAVRPRPLVGGVRPFVMGELVRAMAAGVVVEGNPMDYYDREED